MAALKSLSPTLRGPIWRTSMKRSLLNVAAGIAVLAMSLIHAGPADASVSSGGSDAQRAQSGYAALQRYLAVHDGSGLYHEQYPVAAGNAYSYEWPYSQVHVAALDLTGMAGVGSRYRPALEAHDSAQLHYWSAAGSTGLPGFASGAEPPYGPGGDFFYDDNEWVGLQDVQHWAMYHDSASLSQAQELFRLVESGWDSDASHADPGGVFWTQAPWSSDRNTVSNMPAAELGLRLYQITGEREYLDWSLRMYRWTNTYLQGPDGLFWDHLSLQGTVDQTIWSYNQGVPVGVNVLLYEVTHERRYLDEAVRIAMAAQSYFAGDKLDAQPPFFNSIYFKNLLLLESVTHGSTYSRAAQAYADRIWATNRDPATGLFHFGGSAATQAIEQAAMVQIYAVLAWPRARDDSLY